MEEKKVYAVIGSGRLARHFAHYLRLSGLAVLRWSRDLDPDCNSFDKIQDHRQRLLETIAPTHSVLLLLTDAALAGFIEQYPELKSKELIHASGALEVDGVHSVHPLMSFSTQLYDLDFYRQIPFVCGAQSAFTDLFPQLPNPHYTIKAADKELYHSLCVVAGNFPQFLWAECLKTLTQQLDLPAHILDQYVSKVSQNFIELKQQSLTGPFIRGDHQTVEKNLKALKGFDLERIYQSFVATFLKEDSPHKNFANPTKELQ